MVQIIAKVVLLILIVYAVTGKSENCTSITSSELSKLLPNVHPESEYPITYFELLDFNITCLALSKVQGRYRYISVIASYMISSENAPNETITAQIDLGCSNENKWDTSILGPEVSFKIKQPIPAESIRIDCAVCISDTHPMNANSDPLTHCLTCPSSCIVSNTLSGCTGVYESDCCLMYENGLCVTNCSSDNELIMDNFTCTKLLTVTTTSSNLMMTSIEPSLTYVITVISSSSTQSSITTTTTTATSRIVTILTPTSFMMNNYNNMLMTMIFANIITSAVTCIISFILSIFFTFFIILCAYKCWKKSTGASMNRVSSIGNSVEYIYPLSSPSNMIERTLSTTTTTTTNSDNILMQNNPAYHRSKNSRRCPPSPPTALTAVYEEPDGVPIGRYTQRTGQNEPNNAYITILP